MKNDNYEFLYNYSRSSFEDELQRFKNIEDKASKFICLLSIMIAGYTAIIQFSAKLFFPPKSLFEWLSLIAIALTYIVLVFSWSFLFRSLKFIDMPRLPLDGEFIELFKSRDLPTNHYTLSVTCEQGLLRARESNTKKSKLLIKAYRSITYSVWLISISLIFLIITSYINKGVKGMTEKEENTQTQQQTNQNQPEPDFKATPPKIVMVLDHKIPEADSASKTLNESKE